MKLLFDRADSPNIYYRCGFNSDVRCLYTETKDEKTLYVPGFEFLRAQQEVTRAAVKKLENIKELMQNLQGPFIVSPLFPYSLTQELSGDITVEQEIVPERKTKTDQEITSLMHAQKMAKNAIALIEQELRAAQIQDGKLIKDGQKITSEQLKLQARVYLLENGYDCPEIIVSSGTQTSQPHHRGEGPIQAGPVIIDVFPQSKQTLYHGDMTRTIIVGEHEGAARMLQAVQKAHDACMQAIKPGVRACDIHALCLEILQEEGFTAEDDKGMIHSLGHGIGLAIHERPRLGPNDEDVLEEGMVVTVEPGLYYDVGVRWENVLVVGRGVMYGD